MKNNSRVILWAGLLIVAMVGCVRHEPRTAAAFSELPSAPQPTSDNDAQRVYTITAPNGAQGSLTYGTAANGGNGEIAETVRKMILADPKLAPYPSKVTATMDPNAKGKVVLTGMVPTQAVKKKLVERVREVPGVAEVEDKLVLDLPNKSREVDFREKKD